MTVYRLVAEGTVEEKILRLHETKRSLADVFLEVADMSSRLSKDSWLALPCCLRRRIRSNILLHAVILLLSVDKTHFRCWTSFNNQSEYAKKVC